VVEGEDQIGEFHANERTCRQWCKVCGGHLMARHPQWGMVDVYVWVRVLMEDQFDRDDQQPEHGPEKRLDQQRHS
jgi:hypothetical protein